MRIIYLAIVLIIMFAIASPTQSQNLSSGLISCWNMDEVSGTRDDTAGLNHLSDINTVGFTVGKINNAASFTASNSERLYVQSTDFALSSGDFTLSAWVRFDNTSGIYTIASKGETTPAIIREMLLYFNGGTGIDFVLASDGFNFDGVVSSGIVPTPGQWHFVLAKHDSTANQVFLQVDATPNFASYNAGPPTAGDEFHVGAYLGSAFYMNGDIDSVMFWQRALSNEEIALVYNTGDGLECADVYGNGEPTGPTQIEIDLPSGGTGILSYEVTAGEALIILSLSILVMLIFYQMLQGLGRGAKIR